MNNGKHENFNKIFEQLQEKENKRKGTTTGNVTKPHIVMMRSGFLNNHVKHCSNNPKILNKVFEQLHEWKIEGKDQLHVT
jgi:hypothetical protein